VILGGSANVVNIGVDHSALGIVVSEGKGIRPFTIFFRIRAIELYSHESQDVQFMYLSLID
jgi:hypothetical protein